MPGGKLEVGADGKVRTFFRVWRRGEALVVGIPPELAVFLRPDDHGNTWIEVEEDENKLVLVFPI